MIISENMVFIKDAKWEWSEDQRQHVQIPKGEVIPPKDLTQANFISSNSSNSSILSCNCSLFSISSS